MLQKFKVILCLKVCYREWKIVRIRRKYHREIELPFNPFTLKNNFLRLTIIDDNHEYCEIEIKDIAWKEGNDTYYLWGNFETSSVSYYDKIITLLNKDERYIRSETQK